MTDDVDEQHPLKEGIEAAERGDTAGVEDILADLETDEDRETLAQVVSIKRALESNKENGYSPDELAEFLDSDEEGDEDDPADETELWKGIEDAKNDKFV